MLKKTGQPARSQHGCQSAMGFRTRTLGGRRVSERTSLGSLPRRHPHIQLQAVLIKLRSHLLGRLAVIPRILRAHRSTPFACSGRASAGAIQRVGGRAVPVARGQSARPAPAVCADGREGVGNAAVVVAEGAADFGGGGGGHGFGEMGNAEDVAWDVAYQRVSRS